MKDLYKNNTVNAIVQARMSSSRLPGKVFLPLSGKPVLQHIIERLRRSKYIDNVIVATTTNEADNPIIQLCNKLKCKHYRGSEDDVLSRALEAAKFYNTDIIVEVTADCPCVDGDIADRIIEKLEDNDYISNVINRTFPRGLDLQVFWTSVLERVNKEVDNEVDRQHVSTWIYKNPKTYSKYSTISYMLPREVGNFSNLRLTLDTQEDYELLKTIFEAFENNIFTFSDIVSLLNMYPELPEINSGIVQKSYYKELISCQNILH